MTQPSQIFGQHQYANHGARQSLTITKTLLKLCIRELASIKPSSKLEAAPCQKGSSPDTCQRCCRMHTCGAAGATASRSDEASRNVHANYVVGSPAASFGHIAEAARPPSARLHLVWLLRFCGCYGHLSGQLFFQAALQPQQETSDRAAQCAEFVKAIHDLPSTTSSPRLSSAFCSVERRLPQLDLKTL